ncbi:MAG: universal stress protein [Vicingaceae bacterium]|nr:universal stress protein [Vicingaceae bacterium]
MNKILVPTDFSEHSKYALENAAFIAQKTRAELVVLHIVKNENSVDKESIDVKFQELKSLTYLKFVKVDFVIEYGTNISKLINKVAQHKQVDLIVMGSNGANNTEEIILGSTTENVIRKTEVSVLTVKREIITFELDHVLFPSDFSKESYSIFEEIKAFAKIFGAKIHLLRVNKKDSLADKTTPKMDAFIEHFKLDEEGVQYEKAISTNPSAEFGILNYSVDNQIDVIAIGTHGKGLLKKIIQVSTSQSLVRDAFKPVLTVRFK